MIIGLQLFKLHRSLTIVHDLVSVPDLLLGPLPLLLYSNPPVANMMHSVLDLLGRLQPLLYSHPQVVGDDFTNPGALGRLQLS